MLKRMFAGALFAGLSAGAVSALLQLTFVVPLIQEAELYESGALTHFGGSAPVAPGVDDLATGVQDAAPAGGTAPDEASADDETPQVSRAAGTVGMLIVTWTGFALVLVAGFALAERGGHAVTARGGVVWGLCGFLAFQLAPAFGLPPELPGAGAAALEARQIWWTGSVIATVAALGLLGLGSGALPLAAGTVLLLLPHLIGAPSSPYRGVVPPELSAHFAARALGVGALSWALLGAVAGTLWARGR